jgi:hypothetical protein
MGRQPIHHIAHWKSNPVIVAIVAGAAVFGFSEVYVVPIHTQSLRNEIASNAEVVARAKTTEEKANSLERQLRDALGRVKALELPNLFALGNPYPIGLGLVKLGQPIEDLERAYVGAKIVKSDASYWTLEGFHSVFADITYYFDASSPDRRIKHIRLTATYDSSRDNNFLGNKLVEVLGPPTESPRPEWHFWRLGDAKVNVYFDAGPLVAYMILPEGHMPNWWPRKRPLATGTIVPPKK